MRHYQIQFKITVILRGRSDYYPGHGEVQRATDDDEDVVEHEDLEEVVEHGVARAAPRLPPDDQDQRHDVDRQARHGRGQDQVVVHPGRGLSPIEGHRSLKRNMIVALGFFSIFHGNVNVQTE